MSAAVSVLIPTFNRPAALAVTLACLAMQTCRDFEVVISDQGERNVLEAGEVLAAARVLELHGCAVRALRHAPPRGMAEQRQFLLDSSRGRYSLYLDDDLILEPFVVGQMAAALAEEGCGFVGCGLIGPSYIDELRPQEQHIEFWNGPVRPEDVRPGSPEWERYRLHSAANLYHVQSRLKVSPERTRRYRVAWVGGCVMYDTRKLKAAGGFRFWKELPPVHCGEDVLAQLRVMRRFGGCGLLPSGVYHQELVTTLPDRSAVAPLVLERTACSRAERPGDTER